MTATYGGPGSFSGSPASPAPDFEVLTDGRPERRRRSWPRGILIALVSLLAITGLVAAVEWGSRTAEMVALMNAIDTSEAAMVETQQSLRQVLDDYGNREITEQERQEALDRLAAVATAGYQGVLAGGDAVASVRILPWQRSVNAARAAYLNHNAAWRDYLKAASEDPTEFFIPHPAIDDTWFAAQPILEAAIPVPTILGLRERVAQMYADTGDSADGTSPDTAGTTTAAAVTVSRHIAGTILPPTARGGGVAVLTTVP